jgi:hypothetical protein
VYVTEYGVADLRGKSDSECIEAMLSICDARFIDALCAEAKSHGKLAADFKIPEHGDAIARNTSARPWRRCARGFCRRFRSAAISPRSKFHKVRVMICVSRHTGMVVADVRMHVK